MMARLHLAVALAALVGFPAAAQQAQPQLPPGEGRDIFATACTQCHGLQTVVQIREDADAWRNQVYDMVLRGAQLTAPDVDKVVDYLATNFGPGINVPPATMPVALPDGQGKDLVEAHCVVCHGLDRVASAKRSRADWGNILARMNYFGASLSPDETKTISAYLETKLGAN
jgi:mono/diheme cytochrome c family protein